MTGDVTKGKPDRLGASGPRNAQALPDQVSVINCEPALSFKQDLKGHGHHGHRGHRGHHGHYATSSTVRQDVLALLDGAGPNDILGRQYQADSRSFRLKAV